MFVNKSFTVMSLRFLSEKLFVYGHLVLYREERMIQLEKPCYHALTIQFIDFGSSREIQIIRLKSTIDFYSCFLELSKITRASSIIHANAFFIPPQVLANAICSRPFV